MSGNIRVDDGGLLRVADGGTAGLGVFNDVQRLFQIRVLVHVYMADAGAGFDARNGRRFDAGADEARAAARDEQIDQPVCCHELMRALPRGVRHQIDKRLRQTDSPQALVHGRNDGCGRAICLFPAAQDADVAALERKNRCVGRDVRPAFVDDRHDAHRDGSLADHKAVWPPYLGQNFSDGIRELCDLTHAVRHGGDTVFCQTQTVEHDA